MRYERPHRLKYKPLSEPYRQWDLEICGYCDSHLPLAHDQCSHCGTWRNAEDSRLRDQLVTWRASPEGQDAYQEFERLRDRDRRGMAFLAGLYVFFPVLIVSGLIGLAFFDDMSIGIVVAAAAFFLARWAALKLQS